MSRNSITDFCALTRLRRLRAHDLHAVGRPAWRRPAAAWAPSRPRPGTCGSWPRSTASCGSRNAGRRCPLRRPHRIDHAARAASLSDRCLPSISIFDHVGPFSSSAMSLSHLARPAHSMPVATRLSHHTMHVLCSMWYSNSSRKCLRKPCHRHRRRVAQRADGAALDVVGHVDRAGPGLPCGPCRVSMRCTTRYSQPVPSRHGVHWPQDSS